MINKWITAGAAAGFLGVAIGAFGAHSLKPYLLPDLIDSYKTGVLYHLIHATVILSIGFSGKREFNIAAILFSSGIILFSFSLYIYALTGLKLIAIITPIGGISFLAGWISVIFISLKKQNKK